jgi:dual specificity phosphatase 12
MLDHGQLGPDTPATRSPATSRRPSSLSSHRPSMNSSRPHVSGVTDSRPRRPSLLAFGDSLSMSALDSDEDNSPGDGEPIVNTNNAPPSSTSSLARRVSGPDKPILHSLAMSNLGDPLTMSALVDSDDEDATPSANVTGRTSYIQDSTSMSDETARLIGRRMSDAMISSPVEIRNRSSEKGADQQDVLDDGPPLGPEHHPPTYLFSPAELAAQLNANPNLAALRLPIAMTPLQSASKAVSPISPPILMNPKCSGYFVEPVCIVFVDCGYMLMIS